MRTPNFVHPYSRASTDLQATSEFDQEILRVGEILEEKSKIRHKEKVNFSMMSYGFWI